MEQDDKQEKNILIEMQDPNTNQQTSNSSKSINRQEEETKANDHTINSTSSVRSVPPNFRRNISINYA